MRSLAVLLLLGSCATPIAWQPVPALPRPTTIYAEPELQDATAQAAQTWNEAAGCLIFQTVPEFAPTTIYIRQPIDPRPHSAGTIYWNNSGKIRIEIHNPSLGDALLLWEVVAHELGHALGLPHDSDVRSLMYPRARGGILTDDFFAPAPSVLRYQAEAVRLRYCQ